MLHITSIAKKFAYLVLASLLTFTATSTSGCNSTGKSEWTEYDATGNVVKEGKGTTPQDVGVVEALAPMMDKCKEDEGDTAFIPAKLDVDCNNSSMKVTDRTECIRSTADIATLNMLGMIIHNQQKQINSDGVTCASSVASVGVEYFRKEAVQSERIGKSLTAGAIALATWGVTKELVTGFVAGSATGDTNVQELNVNGTSTGGTGAEGTGGSGGAVTQTVNIGPGTASTATGGGLIMSGEKPINGDGNQDNDSANTSLF